MVITSPTVLMMYGCARTCCTILCLLCSGLCSITDVVCWEGLPRCCGCSEHTAQQQLLLGRVPFGVLRHSQYAAPCQYAQLPQQVHLRPVVAPAAALRCRFPKPPLHCCMPLHAAACCCRTSTYCPERSAVALSSASSSLPCLVDSFLPSAAYTVTEMLSTPSTEAFLGGLQAKQAVQADDPAV